MHRMAARQKALNYPEMCKNKGYCGGLSPVSPTQSQCRGLRKPAWMLAVPYVPCVPYRKIGLANFDAASGCGLVTALPEFEPLGRVHLWPMHAPRVPFLGLSVRGWWQCLAVCTSMLWGALIRWLGHAWPCPHGCDDGCIACSCWVLRRVAHG